MSRILLDQNVPKGLGRLLSGHEVTTAYRMGWSTLGNGDLLRAAEDAGISVMVTCDQNIEHQQNIAGRKIAIVVLSTNDWGTIKAKSHVISAAVDRAKDGTFHKLNLAQVPRPRRPNKPAP